MEGGALIDLAFGPDAAAVPVDDPLHQREPDPDAFVVLGVVKALEHTEQLVDVTRNRVATDDAHLRPDRP